MTNGTVWCSWAVQLCVICTGGEHVSSGRPLFSFSQTNLGEAHIFLKIISRVLIPQTFFMVLIVLHCFYEYFQKKWSVQNQAQCLKKCLNKVWNMLLPIIIILQVRSMTSVSLHELSQAEEASQRLERDYPHILKRLLEKPSFRKKSSFGVKYSHVNKRNLDHETADRHSRRSEQTVRN